MTTKEKMGKFFSNRKKVEILVPNKKRKKSCSLVFFQKLLHFGKNCKFPSFRGKIFMCGFSFIKFALFLPNVQTKLIFQKIVKLKGVLQFSRIFPRIKIQKKIIRENAMGEKKLHENKLPRNVWTLGNDDFSNRRKNEYFVIFAQVFCFFLF